VQILKQIVVIISLIPLLLFAVQTAYPEEDTGFEEHVDPYFGILFLYQLTGMLRA
jgi:hypothetical protein